MNVMGGGTVKATFTYRNRTSSVGQGVTKPIELKNVYQNSQPSNPNHASHLTARISPFSIPHLKSQADRNHQARICSPTRNNTQLCEVVSKSPQRVVQWHSRRPEQRVVHLDNFKPVCCIPHEPHAHVASHPQLRPVYNSLERRNEQPQVMTLPKPRRNPLEPQFQLRSGRTRPDTPPEVRQARINSLNLQPIPGADYQTSCSWCKPQRIDFDTYEQPTHSWC